MLPVKGLHRSGRRAYVEFIELNVPAHGVDWRAKSAPILCLSRDDLRSMIGECGAEVMEIHGSYEREEFFENRSADLIVVWRRSRSG